MGKPPIRPDVVASVAIWISFQVILVFVLTSPERTSRFYFGHRFSVPDSRGIDVCDRLFCGPFLLIARIEDRGAIAGSEVVSLPIQSGWIVNLKEELQQLSIAQLLRIKDNLDRLGMISMIAVSGIRNITAGITDSR